MCLCILCVFISHKLKYFHTRQWYIACGFKAIHVHTNRPNKIRIRCQSQVHGCKVKREIIDSFINFSLALCLSVFFSAVRILDWFLEFHINNQFVQQQNPFVSQHFSNSNFKITKKLQSATNEKTNPSILIYKQWVFSLFNSKPKYFFEILLLNEIAHFIQLLLLCEQSAVQTKTFSRMIDAQSLLNSQPAVVLFLFTSFSRSTLLFHE